MKVKRKILWLIMITVFVLAGTTWIIEANADDTYNFYFQKAPGPVTVNQGTAPHPADLQVKGDTVVTPAPAQSGTPPATVAQAAAVSEESAGFRSWELSLGIAGSRYGTGSSDSPYYWKPPQSSGAVDTAQIQAGLQVNFSENFAFQAETLYAMRPGTTKIGGTEVTSPGSRFDYGAHLVITPFRLPVGKSMRLAFAGLIGGMTVPYHPAGPSNPNALPTATPTPITRAGTFSYGLRAALDLSRKFAVQATVRKLDRFSGTHGVAGLAYLF